MLIIFLFLNSEISQKVTKKGKKSLIKTCKLKKEKIGMKTRELLLALVIAEEAILSL